MAPRNSVNKTTTWYCSTCAGTICPLVLQHTAMNSNIFFYTVYIQYRPLFSVSGLRACVCCACRIQYDVIVLPTLLTAL